MSEKMQDDTSEKSLEDFFAKKDKSKIKKNKSKGKTAKTKFTTTDEIAKKLTEGEVKYREKAAKKQDKKEKEKKVEKVSTEAAEDQPKTAYPIAGADEWNEFEDPSEKDYSGLKVQSLQISAEPEETVEEEEEGEVEIDENGEPIKTKGSASSGPWNKSGGTQPPAAGSPSDPEKPPPPEPKPEPPKPVVTAGKYVPPSRRAAAAMGSDSSTPSRQSRNQKPKGAPQIASDLEFPSLAASSDIAKYSDKNADKNFQAVRKGGQATDNPAGSRPRLELENRYAALGN